MRTCVHITTISRCYKVTALTLLDTHKLPHWLIAKVTSYSSVKMLKLEASSDQFQCMYSAITIDCGFIMPTVYEKAQTNAKCPWALPWAFQYCVHLKP